MDLCLLAWKAYTSAAKCVTYPHALGRRPCLGWLQDEHPAKVALGFCVSLVGDFLQGPADVHTKNCWLVPYHPHVLGHQQTMLAEAKNHDYARHMLTLVGTHTGNSTAHHS